MHVNEIEVDIAFQFFCPMTGELVTGPDHYGPSPATAFLLGREAEDFDYLSAEFESIWQEVRDGHDEDEQSPWQLFEEFCRRLDGHDNLVLFFRCRGRPFIRTGSRGGTSAAAPARGSR